VYVKAWLPAAREVLALPGISEDVRRDLNMNVFIDQWEKYMRWLKQIEGREGASRRVFAHNDAQYGNLLRLTRTSEALPEHHQIVVVDFEYASPNPAAFDIANHFHEWTADYHSSIPHILNPSRYPTLHERRNFYLAYLTQSVASSSVSPETLERGNLEKELDKLDRQVQAWGPASHAMWAVWGIVQAKESVEGKDVDLEFNYIGYARCRMEGFYQGIKALGI
jgi:choline kinase